MVSPRQAMNWTSRLLLASAALMLAPSVAHIYDTYRSTGDSLANAMLSTAAIVATLGVCLEMLFSGRRLGLWRRIFVTAAAVWLGAVVIGANIFVGARAAGITSASSWWDLSGLLTYAVGVPLCAAIAIGLALSSPRWIEELDVAYDIWTEPEPVVEVVRHTGQPRRTRRKREMRGRHLRRDVARLFHLQQGRCVYCAASLEDGYHKDHIIPVSKGGTNTCGNLQLLCKPCNLSKGSRLPIVHRDRRGDLAGLRERLSAMRATTIGDVDAALL